MEKDECKDKFRQSNEFDLNNVNGIFMEDAQEDENYAIGGYKYDHYSQLEQYIDKVNRTFTIPCNIEIPFNFFKGCNDIETIIIDSDFDVSDDCASHFTSIKNLKKFIVNGDSAYYTIDGVLFYDMKKGGISKNFIEDGFLIEAPTTMGPILVSFPHSKQMDEYVIPEGVVGIACSAFEKSQLKSLTIPKSIESIGCAAFFEMNKLKKLYVPNKLIHLDIDHYDDTELRFDLFSTDPDEELDLDVISLWDEVRRQRQTCNDGKTSTDKLKELFLLSNSLSWDFIYSIDDIELLNQISDSIQDAKLNEYGFIQNAITSRIKRLTKASEKGTVHNAPIEELIVKLNDKKERTEAVWQIKRRFLGLDYKNQMQIMSTFLEMSVGYRKWCYTTLKKWREPLLDDKLIELWKKYREPDCRKLLTAILPEEKIVNIIEDLLEGINRRDYFMLIKRFGMCDWFHVDKDLLAKFCEISDFDEDGMPMPLPFENRNCYFYLWGMSMTHQGLSKEECAYIIYLYLHDLLQKKTLDQFVLAHAIYTDDHGNRSILCYDLCSLADLSFPNFNDYLNCVLKIGHYDLVNGILSWMYSINRMLPIFQYHENQQEHEEFCRKMQKMYYKSIISNMPLYFKDIEYTPLCTKDDIVNENCAKLAEYDENPPLGIFIDDEYDISQIPF